MRLLRDVPEVEDKIRSGALSVSTAAHVQGFFVTEKKERGQSYSPEQKQALITQVLGKSRHEAERELVKISPDRGVEQPEVERQLKNERIELRVSVSRALHDKLKRIQDLRAHADPWPSYESTLDYMSEFVLAKIDPLRKPTKLKSA
jgi:hypothetical protein